MSSLYLGYDPGGGGAHGVAAIDARQAACATVPTAEDALDWFRERCRDQEPKALGVDTLTLWSTGPAGWRPADRALRTAYPGVATSVTAPNSLYGAMLINGIAVALALRNAFERLRITETHPKVLYFTLTQSVYDFVQRRDQMVQKLVDWVALGPCHVGDDHAWDALASAFAARQWDTGEWPNDLHQLPCNAGETLIPAHGSEGHYAWPEAAPQEREQAPQAPRRGAEMRGPRGRDRWRIAVERLERSGHDDVAQQIAEYRNARNERAGWDAWLKSNFPALWNLVEEGE